MTDEQKLRLAEKAVLAVLNRIQRKPEVAYHIGAGTTCFELVTAAYSVLGKECGTHEEVMDLVIPGSSDIPHSTPEELLEEA
jgi:hypothetical protein